MTGKSALLLGATGATGKHVLLELIKSEEFTRVGEYGRHVTPKVKLGEGASKVEQKVIDFEKLDDAKLKEGKWDVVFITLGTRRAVAGSAAMFERIDREYVVNAARAAKTDDPSHEQRVVYCSSGGADAKSHFLYMRSKGLTENALAESGYKDTIIFRPGYLLNGDRAETQLIESLFLRPLSKAISLFSLAQLVQIDVSLLGRSIVRAGLLGSSGLSTSVKAHQEKTPSGSPFTVVGNKGAYTLVTEIL